MPRQVGIGPLSFMYLRKVLGFNTVLGVTIPKEFANPLRLEKGKYIEMFLRDDRTIVIKPHRIEPKKIGLNDV
jgi:hypothetical protein